MSVLVRRRRGRRRQHGAVAGRLERQAIAVGLFFLPLLADRFQGLLQLRNGFGRFVVGMAERAQVVEPDLVLLFLGHELGDFQVQVLVFQHGQPLPLDDRLAGLDVDVRPGGRLPWR